MYVIAGATGNTGSRIAEILLQRGKKVRAIGRSKSKLNALKQRGAEIAEGTLQDKNLLKKTFEGATAAYILIPPDPTVEKVMAYMDETGEALTAALKQTKVPNVVLLSSVGAELPSGTGPIAGLHKQEQRLNQLDSNVLNLRPTFFMENFLMNIPMIREMGFLGSPAKPDLSMPMIATKDIGTYAAERLDRLDFQDKPVADLLGPRDYTHTEVARILGAAIGKPDLPYIQFPYDDAKKGMVQSGLSEEMADLYIEMYRAMNDGVIKFQKRNRENTTLTTMEQFAAEVFAPAYKHS
ncbi:MAG TPA: NmrA family NAD(P)-binding protein [Acidobacteriota bacterium]|nr:NmrA family NAD(P)-binding protein [Acidobacteriota bacterium]